MTTLEQRLRELASPRPDELPQRRTDDPITAGRRALRRRRLTYLLGCSVAGVALVGWGALIGPPLGHVHVPDAAADISDAIPVDDNLRTEDDGLAYSSKGVLVRHSGAIVHQRVDDPIPTDESKSVALAVSYGGEERWVYLYWTAGKSGGGSDPAGDPEDFAAWARDLDPLTLQTREMTAVLGTPPIDSAG